MRELFFHGRAIFKRVDTSVFANWLRRTAFALRWLASRSSVRSEGWWSQTGSNRRPPACKAGALPTELWPRSAVNQLMMPIFMKTAWLACRAVARGNQPAFALSGFGVAAFARGSERRLVGLGRFELPTSRLSSARSNQLSYRPNSKNFKPEHARSNPRVLKAIEAKDAPTTKG